LICYELLFIMLALTMNRLLNYCLPLGGA